MKPMNGRAEMTRQRGTQKKKQNKNLSLFSKISKQARKKTESFFSQVILTLISVLLHPARAELNMPVPTQKLVELHCDQPIRALLIPLSFNLLLVLLCAGNAFFTRYGGCNCCTYENVQTFKTYFKELNPPERVLKLQTTPLFELSSPDPLSVQPVFFSGPCQKISTSLAIFSCPSWQRLFCGPSSCRRISRSFTRTIRRRCWRSVSYWTPPSPCFASSSRSSTPSTSSLKTTCISKEPRLREQACPWPWQDPAEFPPWTTDGNLPTIAKGVKWTTVVDSEKTPGSLAWLSKSDLEFLFSRLRQTNIPFGFWLRLSSRFETTIVKQFSWRCWPMTLNWGRTSDLL